MAITYYRCEHCANGTVKLSSVSAGPFASLVNGIVGAIVFGTIGGIVSFGILILPGAVLGFMLGAAGSISYARFAVCETCKARYSRFQATRLRKKALAESDIHYVNFGDGNSLSEVLYRLGRSGIQKLRSNRSDHLS